jgi:hypothetical protein
MMPYKSILLRCIGWFAIAAVPVACSQKGKLGESPNIQYPSGEMSQSAKELFLQGDFSTVKDVRALPAPVLRVFIRTMANPGEYFHATDVIVFESLPWRRLIFAGVSRDRCFVHYEQGGRGHSYLLALFNVTSKDEMKPVWLGYCPARAATFEDLRSWFVKGTCSQIHH